MSSHAYATYSFAFSTRHWFRPDAAHMKARKLCERWNKYFWKWIYCSFDFCYAIISISRSACVWCARARTRAPSHSAFEILAAFRTTIELEYLWFCAHLCAQWPQVRNNCEYMQSLRARGEKIMYTRYTAWRFVINSFVTKGALKAIYYKTEQKPRFMRSPCEFSRVAIWQKHRKVKQLYTTAKKLIWPQLLLT